jgi:hypothetical protein
VRVLVRAAFVAGRAPLPLREVRDVLVAARFS